MTPYLGRHVVTTSSTTPTISPQNGIAPGQAVTVSDLTSPSTTTITAFDSVQRRVSPVR